MKKYDNIGAIISEKFQTVERDVHALRKMEEDGQGLMRETSKWLKIADKQSKEISSMELWKYLCREDNFYNESRPWTVSRIGNTKLSAVTDWEGKCLFAKLWTEEAGPQL